LYHSRNKTTIKYEDNAYAGGLVLNIGSSAGGCGLHNGNNLNWIGKGNTILVV